MRNSNLFTHIVHDTNAPYHLLIGTTVALLCYWLVPFLWWIPFLASLVIGIIIEIEQHFHGGKNTFRESIMDALTTTFPGLIVSIYEIVKFCLKG